VEGLGEEGLHRRRWVWGPPGSHSKSRGGGRQRRYGTCL
jgi:hypothetical protein